MSIEENYVMNTYIIDLLQCCVEENDLTFSELLIKLDLNNIQQETSEETHTRIVNAISNNNWLKRGEE